MKSTAQKQTYTRPMALNIPMERQYSGIKVVVVLRSDLYRSIYSPFSPSWRTGKKTWSLMSVCAPSNGMTCNGLSKSSTCQR